MVVGGQQEALTALGKEKKSLESMMPPPKAPLHSDAALPKREAWTPPVGCSDAPQSSCVRALWAAKTVYVQCF